MCPATFCWQNSEKFLQDHVELTRNDGQQRLRHVDDQHLPHAAPEIGGGAAFLEYTLSGSRQLGQP
jgi:hypothetical protein